MRAPDYSRSDISLFTALTALVAFIAGAWVGHTFQPSAASVAGFAGVAGAAVGGSMTFVLTTYLDRKRRERELVELKASIYAEVADRSARCVSDHLNPWRNVMAVKASKRRTAEWIGKFRPADPVVYPGIAPTIGLLKPDAIFALAHFYFRLDALTRAIDSLTGIYDRESESDKIVSVVFDHQERARLKLISKRMTSCFEPALRALKALEVFEEDKFDREASREYDHLHASGLTLRAALKRFGKKEKDDE